MATLITTKAFKILMIIWVTANGLFVHVRWCVDFFLQNPWTKKLFKFWRSCLAEIFLLSRNVKFEKLFKLLRTVWPDGYIIFSIFGHLEHWKFAQKYKMFAKVGSQFCRILNSYSRNGQKLLKTLPRWRNFAKSGPTVSETLFFVEYLHGLTWNRIIRDLPKIKC